MSRGEILSNLEKRGQCEPCLCTKNHLYIFHLQSIIHVFGLNQRAERSMKNFVAKTEYSGKLSDCNDTCIIRDWREVKLHLMRGLGAELFTDTSQFSEWINRLSSLRLKTGSKRRSQLGKDRPKS